MIRTIAEREFFSNVFGYKFAVAMALCLILLPLGTYVSTRSYELRLERYARDRDAHEKDLTNLHVYSALQPKVDRRPPVLSILSEGLEERVTGIVRADPHRVPCLKGKGGVAMDRNRYTDAFPSLDPVWLLAFILSLVALLFAHDTIAGDRELGTLRLTLSNPVPRHQILLGKYLGGIASLFIPALSGFIAALIVMDLSSAVSLSRADWIAISLIFFFSLTYLSAFFLLGMTGSALTKKRSTCLILLLAVWVTLTQLLPNVSVLVAKNVIPITSMEKVSAERKALDDQKNQKISEIWQVGGQAMGGRWRVLVSKRDSNGQGSLFRFMSPETAEVLRTLFRDIENVEIRHADRIARLDRSFVRQLERQQGLADLLAGPSLAGPFSSVVCALAGTDVEAFKTFVEDARQYRLGVLSFLNERETLDSYRLFTDDSMEDIQTDWPRALEAGTRSQAELAEQKNAADSDPKRLLDLSGMPRFSQKKEGVSKKLSRTGRAVGILLVSNIVLFLLAFLFFLRYDPR